MKQNFWNFNWFSQSENTRNRFPCQVRQKN